MAYDPLSGREEGLEAVVRLGVETAGERHVELLRGVARTYGVDYCPVYSVLGSIVSQEVIKVVEST
jgi:ubiquitin-like 1-activating enzyme E1 A